MADYKDLRDLAVDSPLLNRTEVAVWVKAQEILDDGTSNAAKVEWAKDAMASTRSKAEQLLKYVIAKNRTASVTQIKEAIDTTLQNNVDSAIDALIAGGV